MGYLSSLQHQCARLPHCVRLLVHTNQNAGKLCFVMPATAYERLTDYSEASIDYNINESLHINKSCETIN